MKSNFLSLKRIVIPILTFVLVLVQLTGCNPTVDKELLSMINSGESIFIEVAKPSYDKEVVGEPAEEFTWVQLDRLKTYNNGFRQDFDKVFNINIITENGEPGKNGCLFVGEDGHRNGNTTLEDALRNKSFVNKYWGDEKTQRELSQVSSEAYVDMDSNQYRIAASLNAYYNLLPDNVNPASFNPTQSLTREQFMSLVFRSEEGVQDITINKDFENAVGGLTEYTKYAQGTDQYGWLTTENKGLDGVTYKGSITRAEAVYLMVNKHFSEELAKITKKDDSYSDMKNAGDLASKVGFKDKQGIGKEKWQSYVLAYMTEHPDSGMQEELYNTLVIARKLGLIEGNESRWDEPISKAEAIQLIVNVHLVKNDLYGFMSEAEYGEMEISEVDNTEDKDQKPIDTSKVTGTDEHGFKQGDGWTEIPEGMTPADPNKVLPSGFTLREAKDLINITMSASNKSIDDPEIQDLIKGMGTTVEELSRVPDEEETAPVKPVETVKPAETAKPVKPSKPETKPTSPPAGDGNNTGNGKGSYPVTERDKNGNGIMDSIEQYQGELGPSMYDGNDPGEGKLH